MSAFSLLSCSVYQQPVIHCFCAPQCVCEHVWALCVSVYGAAWCPAPKCVVSLPCRVGGCRETPCLCMCALFTTVIHILVHPPCWSLLALSTLTHHYHHQEHLTLFIVFTQTQHNSGAIQYSVGGGVRQLELFPAETWCCNTFLKP